MEREEVSAAPGRAVLGRWVLAVVLLVCVGGAVEVRTRNPAFLRDEAGVFFFSNDTVRRLARLEHLERASEYPAVDPRDGAPEGTVLHWTRPMDWAIQLVERWAPAVHPAARGNESGAAWAGPVLAGLGVLLFGLLVARVFGAWAAVATTPLYAATGFWVHATRLGIGDHQSLQHLGLLGGYLGLAGILVGRGGGSLALFAGFSLGGALWVSTESMAAVGVAFLAAWVFLLAAPAEERRARLPALAVLAIACLATVLVGERVEAGFGAPRFEWDRPSALQVLGCALPAVSLLWILRSGGELPSRGRVLLLGLVPLLILAALFTALPPWREALAGQLESLRAADRWARAEVVEYLAAWREPNSTRVRWAGLASLCGPWVFLAPLLALGLVLDRRRSRAASLGLAFLALALLGLGASQVKLLHWFAILHPLLLWLGAAGFASRLRLANAVAWGAALWVFLAFGFAFGLRQRLDLDANLLGAQAEKRGMLELLAEQRGSPGATVLASWDLGAHVIYYAGKPAVATGYHRNLAGIEAAARFFTTADAGEARAILEAHRVGWVLRSGSPRLFLTLDAAFLDLGKPGEPVESVQEPAFPTSPGSIGPGGPRFEAGLESRVWSRLGSEGGAFLGLVDRGRSPAQAGWYGGFFGPRYRLYAVPGPGRSGGRSGGLSDGPSGEPSGGR